MATSRLTLVLGGARSGKSAYATRLAQGAAGPVHVIATARAGDEEMRRRIAAHQRARPPSWATTELAANVGQAVRDLPARATVVIDDLGMLVTNHLMSADSAGPTDAATVSGAVEEAVGRRVGAEIDALLAALADSAARHVIVVSNEVGLGVVPPSALGRLFRDELGRANQRLAARADQVVLCVAGLATVLKGADPIPETP